MRQTIKINKKSFFRLFGLIMGIFTFLPVQAHDLTLSPVNTQLQINGGEEKYLEYTLTNNSLVPLLINLTARSFQPDELYGQPIMAPTNDFPYLSLTENNQEATAGVELAPHHQKTIKVKFAPPLGISEKEFPLTLLFTAQPLQPTPETEINFNLGSNVIIRTDRSNLDKSRLSIDDIAIPKLIDSFQPPTPTIKVLNHGSTATLIKGGAILKRKNGSIIKEWTFYSDLVLGQSSRLARSENTLDVVGNTALLTNYDFPLPLLGEYFFEVQIYSGYAQGEEVQPQIFTFSFFALPYWLIIGAIIILLLIVSISYIIKGSRSTQSKKSLTQKVDQMKAQKDFFASE